MNNIGTSSGREWRRGAWDKAKIWRGGLIATPVAFALFLIQPATFLLILTVILWQQPRATHRSMLLLAFFGALYLGLINVTKVPESDLANYLASLADAKQLELTDYLLLNSREPLYYLSLYYLGQLQFFDGKLFVLFFTVSPYLLLQLAVLRLGRALTLDHRFMISLLTALIFLPQLFSLSAHLMRQFFASSLIMLFLADAAISGRRRWLVGSAAVLLHYSALPFLLLSLLRPRKSQRRQIGSLFYSMLLLLGGYVFIVSIAPWFQDVPVLGMIAGRLLSGEGAELEPLNLVAQVLAVLSVLMALYMMSRTREKEPLVDDWSIQLTTITVCTTVLASAWQPSLSEIATRYFFYLYFLLGLSLPLLMKRLRFLSKAIYLLALAMPPFFYYKIANGEWTFAPISNLLFYPAWMLWNHVPFSKLY